MTGHPDADDILRYTAGHHVGTERHAEIEEHLATCPGCGLDFDIASEICTAIAIESDALEPAPPPPPPDARPRGFRAAARRLIDETHHRSWWSALLDHRDRDDPRFLWEVADRAVWYADEDPDAVLRFARVLRSVVTNLEDGSMKRHLQGPTLALVGLAEGAAWGTKGDHAAALRAYADAEASIEERISSHELSRVNLARSGSLRHLNRLDEARAVLLLARQGFARITDATGEAKAAWSLANIEWQAGDARRAFRLARSAHRRFVELGDHESEVMVLQTIALALIGMLRPRPAARLLRSLASHEAIRGNPRERARVAWKLGETMAIEGRFEEALETMERASDELRIAGDPRAAANAMLDVAHVAGQAGDLARQVEAARAALAILGSLPRIETEAGLALAEIERALAAGSRVAEAIALARKGFRAN